MQASTTPSEPPPRPKNPPPLEGPLSAAVRLSRHEHGDLQEHSKDGATPQTGSFTSPSLSAVTDTSTPGCRVPYLRIVRGTYGAGTGIVDVTDKLQQMVQTEGGLTLKAFGYKGLKPNGCMNQAFGDPAPGVDKQLYFSYEIVGGNPHLITVPEDHKLKLTMKHMYRKVLGHLPPDEAKLVGVEIIKATYGRGNNSYDVTSTLRTMLAEQGGHGLKAFGFKLKPNGCMNKAFGDPCPGEDKILAIEYRWQTRTLAHAIEEDKMLSLSFEKLRPLL